MPSATSTPNSLRRSASIISKVEKMPNEMSRYNTPMMMRMLPESVLMCSVISGNISSQVMTS